jgi:hypothetical protein
MLWIKLRSKSFDSQEYLTPSQLDSNDNETNLIDRKTKVLAAHDILAQSLVFVVPHCWTATHADSRKTLLQASDSMLIQLAYLTESNLEPSDLQGRFVFQIDSFFQ